MDVPRSSYDVTCGGLMTCKLFLGLFRKSGTLAFEYMILCFFSFCFGGTKVYEGVHIISHEDKDLVLAKL